MIKHICTNLCMLYAVAQCSNKCSLKVCMAPPHRNKDCTNYFQIRNVLSTQKVPVLLYLSLSLLVTHGKIQTVSLKDAVARLGLFQMQLPPEGVEVSM